MYFCKPKSRLCGVRKYFTAGYQRGLVLYPDWSPEQHIPPLFPLWANNLSTEVSPGHPFAMISRVFPGKALAPPGPAYPWAVWPLGWACSPLWQAVICHKAQALITPAISLPSRAADVINGHEIIQCLSKLQSQSVFVPVTSHSTSLFFFFHFAAVLNLNLEHK